MPFSILMHLLYQMPPKMSSTFSLAWENISTEVGEFTYHSTPGRLPGEVGERGPHEAASEATGKYPNIRKKIQEPVFLLTTPPRGARRMKAGEREFQGLPPRQVVSKRTDAVRKFLKKCLTFSTRFAIMVAVKLKTD